VLYFETLAQGVIYSYNKTTKGKLFENLIICSNSRWVQYTHKLFLRPVILSNERGEKFIITLIK